MRQIYCLTYLSLRSNSCDSGCWFAFCCEKNTLFVHKILWSEWIGGDKGSLAHPTRMPQAARRDCYGCRAKKNCPPILAPGDCCPIRCQQPYEGQPTIAHCLANNTRPSGALKGKCPKGVSTKRLQVQILLFFFIYQ